MDHVRRLTEAYDAVADQIFDVNPDLTMRDVAVIVAMALGYVYAGGGHDDALVLVDADDHAVMIDDQGFYWNQPRD